MKNRILKNWGLSLITLVMAIACTSEVFSEPKDWTVTWADNSDNESDFALYQFDTTLATPDWVLVAVLPADTETAVIQLDASNGSTVSLTARNPAGESGRATHTIDSKFFLIPAMPGFIDFTPTS
jgi:hypothetical protein